MSTIKWKEIHEILDDTKEYKGIFSVSGSIHINGQEVNTQGPQGPTGSQGPQGSTGPQGPEIDPSVINDKVSITIDETITAAKIFNKKQSFIDTYSNSQASFGTTGNGGRIIFNRGSDGALGFAVGFSGQNSTTGYITSNAAMYLSAATSAQIESTGTTGNVGISASGASGYVNFISGNNQSGRIFSNGSWRIGSVITVNSSYKFTVDGSTNLKGNLVVESGSAVLPTDTQIGTVTSTEIGYLSSVSSSIQTQLDSTAKIAATQTFTGVNTFNQRIIGTKIDGNSAGAVSILLNSAGTGSVGINTITPLSTNGGLDVSSGGIALFIGADNGANSRSNNVFKSFKIAAPHYSNAEEPVGIMSGYSDTLITSITIGGGLSIFNTATELRFNTAGNTTTLTGTTRLYIDNNGLVGINTIAPLSTIGGLDIASGGLSLIIGADSLGIARTNNNPKNSRFGAAHYSNTEEPLGLIFSVSNSTSNLINIGGGSSIVNAATQIDLYTASNTTTTSGTSRLTINNAGLIGIGTTPTHTITLPSTSTGYVHYNQVDQSTNYERFRIYWNSDILRINTESGGTGTSRSIALGVAGTSQVLLTSSQINIGNSVNTTATVYATAINYNSTASSGTPGLLAILSTINQTSSAGYKGVWVSLYELATGSGSKMLIDLGTNAAANGSGTHTSVFSVSSTGILSITTPVYVDNAAALSGGLVAGNVYRNTVGVLMVVY